MRLSSAPERRVLLLQRATVSLFGPHGSVTYLHTYDAALDTNPTAAARIGGRGGVAGGAVSPGHRREAGCLVSILLTPAKCPTSGIAQWCVGRKRKRSERDGAHSVIVIRCPSGNSAIAER